MGLAVTRRGRCCCAQYPAPRPSQRGPQRTSQLRKSRLHLHRALDSRCIFARKYANSSAIVNSALLGVRSATPNPACGRMKVVPKQLNEHALLGPFEGGSCLCGRTIPPSNGSPESAGARPLCCGGRAGGHPGRNTDVFVPPQQAQVSEDEQAAKPLCEGFHWSELGRQARGSDSSPMPIAQNRTIEVDLRMVTCPFQAGFAFSPDVHHSKGAFRSVSEIASVTTDPERHRYAQAVPFHAGIPCRERLSFCAFST